MVHAQVPIKLKNLVIKASEVTGESQSTFIRKSITEKLERLGIIQEELQKELK